MPRRFGFSDYFWHNSLLAFEFFDLVFPTSFFEFFQGRKGRRFRGGEFVYLHESVEQIRVIPAPVMSLLVHPFLDDFFGFLVLSRGRVHVSFLLPGFLSLPFLVH